LSLLSLAVLQLSRVRLAAGGVAAVNRR
jgi:hypothetical protein